jgi:hypothetical protein
VLASAGWVRSSSGQVPDGGGNNARAAREARRNGHPAGKPLDLLYSTAARWRDGKIIEEYLFYDNGAFLSQVGLA